MFIVSAEKGDLTLEETPRIKNKAGLFPIAVDNLTQVEKTKQWLLAHCRYRDENNEQKLKDLEKAVGYDVDAPARKFYSCGIDTVTELQAFATYLAKGYGLDIALDADLTKTEWDHFNSILDRMQIMMRAYRDLSMHIIFLAQEQFMQDENKRMIMSPALQGQMARRVQGFVDIVGYLVKIKKTTEQGQPTEEVIHRLWLQPPANGKFAAKNRVGSFGGSYIDNPSMPTIVSTLGL